MSNTPNNLPEQNQPPQNPPPQNPPPQNPPPQNSPANPFDFIIQLLPEQLRNLLTNPLIAQLASRHPLTTNLVILVFFSFTGINILQLNYRIDKNTECDNFKEELKDKMHLKDIKLKPPEILSKPVETNDSIKPLFNCEYTIQRYNENPSQETFVVVPQLLLADLTKDANYVEHPINMEDVCRDPYITKKLTGEIREKDPKQDISLVPKGAILQKEYRNIYPVFRWECNYEIQRKQKNGRTRRTTEAFGISIDEDYCQQKYKQEEATKATHHDYNDPYSLYCTRPDPK